MKGTEVYVASHGARSTGSPLSTPFARADHQHQGHGQTPPPEVVLRRVPDRRARLAREHLLDRLESEFIEMPGLSLNVLQTARLMGITPEICGRMLATLADRGVLTVSADGRYSRDLQRA